MIEAIIRLTRDLNILKGEPICICTVALITCVDRLGMEDVAEPEPYAESESSRITGELSYLPNTDFISDQMMCGQYMPFKVTRNMKVSSRSVCICLCFLTSP